MSTIRDACRACGSGLAPILSLGNLYVSGFPRPDEPDGEKAPLDLVLCKECWLLQLRHTVSADVLYTNYWYRSGTNVTMRRALADLATKAEVLIKLRSGDVVLDIGCNDGTLLSSYRCAGLYKVGFDPATNLAELSRRVADKLCESFFDAATYFADPLLAARRPKLVTSIAMFYDLDDPGRCIDDIKAVMDPDGLWIVQMSYLPLMLREHEIGNICHEHVGYYCLRSLEHVLDAHGMEVVDVELNDVNGGSLRAYIRPRGADPRLFGDQSHRSLAARRVEDMRAEEEQMGLTDVRTYTEFAAWADRIKGDVVGFIRAEVARGKKVHVYGASTKGNTVLQYFGLDASLVSAAAERDPSKWGRVTVGTRIPIISEEQSRAEHPDYFLVLPWHFLSEFKEREKQYLQSGGRFIMPAPHFALI